jgi:hypothetical protein
MISHFRFYFPAFGGKALGLKNTEAQSSNSRSEHITPNQAFAT